MDTLRNWVFPINFRSVAANLNEPPELRPANRKLKYKRWQKPIDAFYETLNSTWYLRAHFQTCSDSWTCSCRFLRMAVSSVALPSASESTGREWSCFSIDSLSSVCNLENVMSAEKLHWKDHFKKQQLLNRRPGNLIPIKFILAGDADTVDVIS